MEGTGSQVLSATPPCWNRKAAPDFHCTGNSCGNEELGAVVSSIWGCLVFVVVFFFNCKMTWHCCVLFRVFPSVIFGTSALGCADHWSCTISYLKPQEKSIVEIMNVVIWRRRVEEKILMMLKGVIVRLRKQRHTLPAVFSPSWKQQIVSKQHRNTFSKCIPRQICEDT